VPALATRPRSLRARSTSITCSAFSLVIGEQFGLATSIFGFVGGTRSGAGDRP
jgi:hypothetical protein